MSGKSKSNIRIKYIRFAHPTAQSLRARASVYAGRQAQLEKLLDLVKEAQRGQHFPLEGKVYFGLFQTYIRFVVQDSASIEYVQRCAVYLNSISDALIEQLCEASIRYCNDFLYEIGEPKLSFATPRDILRLVTPTCLIVPNPENGDEPIIHLELNCEWEIEHGLEWVARKDQALYVGAFNDEYEWADFSQKKSWNYA